MCTSVLIGKPPPPLFGLIYEDAIGETRNTTSLCDPLVETYEEIFRKLIFPSYKIQGFETCFLFEMKSLMHLKGKKRDLSTEQMLL
jgi:hypothetical protein